MNRRYLNLQNNDLKTGFYGVDVDKVLVALQYADWSFAHRKRNGSLFGVMDVKRSKEGEVTLHFPSYKSVPENILQTIAYRLKTTMQILTARSVTGEVTGTNFMDHLDDEVAVTFDKEYVYFQNYRPDLAALLKGNVMRITVGYVRALYELLSGRDEDAIGRKYGEDVVEQIKGTPYNGFVQGAVEGLRQQIQNLREERDKKQREISSECSAQVEEVRRKFDKVRNTVNAEYKTKIDDIEAQIQEMIESAAVGI